jgi:hypothetical protein
MEPDATVAVPFSRVIAALSPFGQVAFRLITENTPADFGRGIVASGAINYEEFARLLLNPAPVAPALSEAKRDTMSALREVKNQRRDILAISKCLNELETCLRNNTTRIGERIAFANIAHCHRLIREIRRGVRHDNINLRGGYFVRQPQLAFKENVPGHEPLPLPYWHCFLVAAERGEYGSPADNIERALVCPADFPDEAREAIGLHGRGRQDGCHYCRAQHKILNPKSAAARSTIAQRAELASDLDRAGTAAVEAVLRPAAPRSPADNQAAMNVVAAIAAAAGKTDVADTASAFAAAEGRRRHLR